MFHGNVEIVENVLWAKGTWRMRLAAPELARRIAPGQFFMLRLPGQTDPLLGRPFALYDTVLDASGEPIAVDLGYLVVGKMTGRMTRLRPGDSLEVWGPLGNGFPDLTGRSDVALVAGGIGQTPFLAYARALRGVRGYAGQPPRRQVERVRLFYGVRSAELAAGVDDFREAGAEVLLASDDGTVGRRGFVTDLLASQPRPSHVLGCGPEPMLHALAKLTREWNVPCHLSLETPMACGVGICFSCVTKVQTSEGWDYRRVCVDGPVFDAACLVIEHA